jgi:iron complex transport system substrate-binding protein
MKKFYTLTDKFKQTAAKKKHWRNATIVIVMIVLAAIMLRYSSQTPPNNAAGGKLRIVSLAPNLTEMLFVLGLQDFIVGVTNCCDYPPEAKNIECVGSFGKPNIEKMLALHPDMVVAADLENNDVAELLSKSGIQVLDLRIRSFQEMFEALRKIGQITGRQQQAEKIIRAMQAELKATAERFKEIPSSQRPRVFIEIWYDPITTAGRTSFIDEVITCAGGINVAGNINQDYPCINPEKVIEWNPDVIVLCYMEQKEHSASQLAGRIGWTDISAIRKGRIINDISSDIILRPGPRLIKGVRALAQRLYGTEVEKHAAGDKPVTLAGVNP